MTDLYTAPRPSPQCKHEVRGLDNDDEPSTFLCLLGRGHDGDHQYAPYYRPIPTSRYQCLVCGTPYNERPCPKCFPVSPEAAPPRATTEEDVINAERAIFGGWTPAAERVAKSVQRLAEKENSLCASCGRPFVEHGPPHDFAPDIPSCPPPSLTGTWRASLSAAPSEEIGGLGDETDPYFVLDFCAGAIRDAITLEDGLDASAGYAVLNMIKAAKAARVDAREAERLRAALEEIDKSLDCRVILMDYPKGTTCLGREQIVADDPARFGERYRADLLAGKHRCANCRNRAIVRASLRATPPAETETKP